MNRPRVLEIVQNVVSRVLGVSAEKVQPHTTFVELECTDAQMNHIITMIHTAAEATASMDKDLAKKQPTVSGLANYLFCQMQPQAVQGTREVQARPPKICHWVF